MMPTIQQEAVNCFLQSGFGEGIAAEMTSHFNRNPLLQADDAAINAALLAELTTLMSTPRIIVSCVAIPLPPRDTTPVTDAELNNLF